ncbi:MAG: site-specific integrase [Methylocella sp.]
MTDRSSPRQGGTVATDDGTYVLAPSPPAIIPTSTVGLPPELAADLNQAGEFARAEKAMATRRAYKSDFEIFELWCANRGVGALPAAAETVAALLASEAMRRIKPSTIGRRAASIRYVHKLAGHPVPTDDERVRATVRGIRRAIGIAPSKKAPATADRLIAMAAAGNGGITALRDRALLLLGFGGAFRRSELVALDVADITETKDGLLVTIRRSKTDQEGRSTTVAVVRGKIACPVAALRAWLTVAGISDGPVFRPITKSGKVRPTRLTDRSVANIVKYRAERLGLDPRAFAGHSLRAGFLTSAAARGASLFKMADVSRHKSMDTLRGYVRDTEVFKNHAGEGLL